MPTGRHEAVRSVRVEGLDTFAPSIDLEGNLAISFRPDTAFANGLSDPGVFTGTILNRENIGTASPATGELVTRWNSDNPADQVIFSAS